MTGAPTKEQIDARFREKAAQQHPDKGGSHEGMAQLNEARNLAFEEIDFRQGGFS